ncbi:MAG: aspartate/glutamate racemase family protein [Acidobacteriota bacterium]
MKIIGLIGGMSWESSAEYYRIINQTVRKLLGGQHSAKTLMYSVDFHDIEQLQREDRWEEAALEMIECAQRLERGGADFIVLCTNTMHKLAVAIEREVSIPLVHIADATAVRIKQSGIKRVGLLGTRFTMEQDFYKGRLMEQHRLEVIVPDITDRNFIHKVIYDELCQGKILVESKQEYLRIIESLAERGAEGIILGCTEIPLLVKPEDTFLQLFDTTQIHAEEAVTVSLR